MVHLHRIRYILKCFLYSFFPYFNVVAKANLYLLPELLGGVGGKHSSAFLLSESFGASGRFKCACYLPIFVFNVVFLSSEGM